MSNTSGFMLRNFRSMGNPHGLRFVEGEGGETAPAEASSHTEQQADDPKPAPPAREETDWKAEARKWESRAKENSEAAKRLTEIEDANKTELQRATEAQQAANDRAAKAEAAVLRRDVAIEHGLSKEDAALLEGVTDEDTLRAIAARLASQQQVAQQQAPTGFHMDQTGRTATPPTSDDELARAFFGI